MAGPGWSCRLVVLRWRSQEAGMAAVEGGGQPGHTSNRSREDTMFARTSRWSGDPAALDKWAEHVTTKVASMAGGLPGNAGAVFLIDRQANQALT